MKQYFFFALLAATSFADITTTINIDNSSSYDMILAYHNTASMVIKLIDKLPFHHEAPPACVFAFLLQFGAQASTPESILNTTSITHAIG